MSGVELVLLRLGRAKREKKRKQVKKRFPPKDCDLLWKENQENDCLPTFGNLMTA